MRLQFIGSGDAFGSGGRFNTCFHLTGARTNALIDCGASSLIALKRADIERNAINTILITHFHADHFGGIPFFVLDAQLVAKRTAAAADRRPAWPARLVRPAVRRDLSGRADAAVSAHAAGSRDRQTEHDRRTARHALCRETRRQCRPLPRLSHRGGRQDVLLFRRHRMDRRADRGRARRRSLCLRMLHVREGRARASLAVDLARETAADRRQARDPHAYERGHAGAVWQCRRSRPRKTERSWSSETSTAGR